MFVNELSSNLNNFKNYWTDVDKTTLTNLYCPDFINISNINVYFPTHSVETYETKMKYVLVAKIYIDNVEVVLGNFLIDRFDAVACEKPRKFLNQTYYEQRTITIPDPHYIVYHDDWKRWRMYNIYKSSELNFLSGDELEQFIENYQESNDTTSNIVLQFYPVEYVDNKYIKSIVYQGGQNSIQFNDGE
jgi:hypothetical protein